MTKTDQIKVLLCFIAVSLAAFLTGVLLSKLFIYSLLWISELRNY